MSYSRLDLDMLIQKYYQDIKDGVYNHPEDVSKHLYDFLEGCHLTSNQFIEYDDEISYLVSIIYET